jgi:hypothetical protein
MLDLNCLTRIERGIPEFIGSNIVFDLRRQRVHTREIGNTPTPTALTGEQAGA